MHNISIRKMRLAVLAAEEGNFTIASKKAGISQPAMATVIKEVEETVGSELFVRKGNVRTSELTDQGNKVIKIFSRMVIEYDEEMWRVMNLQVEAKKSKKILIQQCFVNALSSYWLEGLVDLFGDQQIELTTSERVDIVDEIRSKNAFLGIVDGENRIENADYYPLGLTSMEMVLIVGKDQRDEMKGKNLLDWSELPSNTIIFAGGGDTINNHIKRQLSEIRKSPDEYFNVNNEEILAKVAKKGERPILLPSLHAHKIFNDRCDNYVVMEGPPVNVSIGVIMQWGSLHKFDVRKLRDRYTDQYAEAALA